MRYKSRWLRPALAGLAMTGLWLSPGAFAEEFSSPATLRAARADYLFRQRQYAQALQELGQLPKETQEDPLFRSRVERALASLYQPRRSIQQSPPEGSRLGVTQSIRVTRRKQDADRSADQSGDNRGWQINEHLEAQVKLREDLDGRFVMDLDGFKNGHNDLRYRTLLADLARGESHLALGDSASYLSPYFLRGSRFRGMNLLFRDDLHEFQAVLGAYPVWLESRDEYVYPRTVWGIRDRVRLLEDRFRLGANLIQTRDSEKIRTDDGANPQARVDLAIQPRDNVVFSLDQELELIPKVLFLKAAEGYSITDENLLEDRFGNTTPLKDTSFQVESLLIQPLFRWKGSFERIGPDFRVLTDLPSGAVNSPKDIRADIMRITQSLDFNLLGPLDMDLEASWVRNNLDNDDSMEHTRQGWYTAQMRLDLPPGWPRPGFRGTFYETVSSPGSTTQASQTRSIDLRVESPFQWQGIQLVPFGTYETNLPQADKSSFDEEESWSCGTQLGYALGKWAYTNLHYRYLTQDEEVLAIVPLRLKSSLHEVDSDLSLRLWSTSSLGLGYSFRREKQILPELDKITTKEEGHIATISYTWPYTHFSRDKRRKLSLFPAVTFHMTDWSGDIERRPFVKGRMSLDYEAFQQWKVQLMGEFGYDKDEEDEGDIRTEGSRVWLLWTSTWD